MVFFFIIIEDYVVILRMTGSFDDALSGGFLWKQHFRHARTSNMYIVDGLYMRHALALR